MTDEVYPFEPDWCIAPASTIRDWMEEHSCDVSTLAHRCEISLERLTRILQGAPYGPVTAYRLASGMGSTARFWMNLETFYREGLRAGKTDTSSFEPIEQEGP